LWPPLEPGGHGPSQMKARRPPSGQRRRPASANRVHLRPPNRGGFAVAGLLGHEWKPAEPEWQRAQVSGCVKKPKLQADEAKLKDLCFFCRVANFREVRALVFHWPYLLALSDSYGFTALHHAQMSGDAEFMAQLLELYHDPRTFTRKFVRFESEEELRSEGLRLQYGSCSRSKAGSAVGSKAGSSVRSADNESVVVEFVHPGRLCATAGIMPGDTVEGLESQPVRGRPQSQGQNEEVTIEDIFDVVMGDRKLGSGFPLTLEFHGPACTEILGRNGWTPLHAAAGAGKRFEKVCELLNHEQLKLPVAAQDGHGCTPEHWSLISRRSSGYRRRPLSAGPCGPNSRHASRGSARAGSSHAEKGRAPRSPGWILEQAPPCTADIP